MNRDTAVASVARRLGNRTNLNTDIIAEMQVMQSVLERDLTLRPWFLLTDVESLSTTSGEEKVQLPSDFLYEGEETGLFWYDASVSENNWTELVKVDYDDAVSFYNAKTGSPEAYALVGNYFRIYPTPDAAYTFKCIYYAADTVLSSNIENQWLKYAPQLLIAETGMTMAGYLQNKIAHGFFKGLRDSERSRVAIENTSREWTGRELIMGGA